MVIFNKTYVAILFCLSGLIEWMRFRTSPSSVLSEQVFTVVEMNV